MEMTRGVVKGMCIVFKIPILPNPILNSIYNLSYLDSVVAV